MEHSEDTHVRYVEMICRLCCDFVAGRVTEKRKRIHATCKQKYEADIRHFFKLDISNDIEGTHSSRICHKCSMNISNLKNRPLTPSAISKAHKKGQSSNNIFCSFDKNVSLEECSLCSHVQSKKQHPNGKKHKADTHLIQLQSQIMHSNNERTSIVMETSSLNAESTSSPQPIYHNQLETLPEQIFESAPQTHQPTQSSFYSHTMPFPNNQVSFQQMPYHIYAMPTWAYSMAQKRYHMPHQTYTMPYHFDSFPYPSRYQVQDTSTQATQLTYRPEMHISHHSQTMPVNTSYDISGLQEQTHWISRPAQPSSETFLNSSLSQNCSANWPAQNDFSPHFFSTPKKKIKLKPDHSPTKKSPKISPLFKRRKRNASTSPIKPLNLISFCDKPLSDKEIAIQRKACAKLISNLSYDNSVDSETITIPSKTKGQPKIFKRITKPRKKSSEICRATLKKRVKEQAGLRHFISGGESLIQQAAEINCLPKENTKTLRQILGKRKVIINKKVGAALKTHAQLSYCQFNKIKRFLKEYFVNFENEGAIRKELKRLSAHKIDILDKDFEFTNDDGDVITKTTPLLKISDLKTFTINLLNKLTHKNLLTWHDGVIPSDEIWVKIGGDHGRDSFKVSFQIANVHKPNSKHYTFMIGFAKVKDTPSNLKLIFDDFKEDIENLDGMEWEGKKIKLFIVGDYAFLANIYGISGASGKHPCLWCLETKLDMQSYSSSKDASKTRTVEQLNTNHKQFIEKGNAKIKEASKYNNAIREPLLNIPLSQVTPPVLHILLGVVKKHHTILEDYCDSLDIEIINDLLKKKKTLIHVSKSLKIFIKKFSKIKSKEKVNYRNLNQSDNQETKKEIKLALASLQEEKQKLFSKYPKRQGPVCSELDGILKKTQNRITSIPWPIVYRQPCK